MEATEREKNITYMNYPKRSQAKVLIAMQARNHEHCSSDVQPYKRGSRISSWWESPERTNVIELKHNQIGISTKTETYFVMFQ